jgi:hypothetical protein
MLGFTAVTQAFAQSSCDNVAGRGDLAVREQYQQTIDYYIKLAAAAQIKGFNPRNFPQPAPTGPAAALDFVGIVLTLAQQRDEAITTVFQAYHSCRDRNNVESLQAVDAAATFFVGQGLRQSVPPSAAYIDAQRLLNGTPLAERVALDIQTREALFVRLGINGNAADLIRNPLQIGPSGPVRIPGQVFGGPNSLIKNPNGIFGELPGVPASGSVQVTAPPVNPSLAPLELGQVGGHRVCIPWC